MNVLIVSNIHREPSCLPHVKHLNPRRLNTPDYPFRESGGTGRCFHGHTNILRCYMTDETAWVMEDDCLPDERFDWWGAVCAASDLAKEGWDFVCLHGRGFDFYQFEHFFAYGRDWIKPFPNQGIVQGTLSYVASREGAEKICAKEYLEWGGGLDAKLWFTNYKWCMLDPRQFMRPEDPWDLGYIARNPRPFIHNMSNGSIIEHPYNTQYIQK